VLSGLSAFENRPWHSMRRGAEITEAWLAQRLRPYGIKPQTIRVGDDVGRGYLAEDFTESLRRYVPKLEREELLAELKARVARREEERKTELAEIERMAKPISWPQGFLPRPGWRKNPTGANRKTHMKVDSQRRDAEVAEERGEGQDELASNEDKAMR